MIYVIFDNKEKKPYLPITIKDKSKADSLLRDLVKPYPENSIWKKRLSVKAMRLQVAQKYFRSKPTTEKTINHSAENQSNH
jgi:hypothetical protein